MENDNENNHPCVHGDLCRQYMRKKRVILCDTCPKCEYYEPKIDMKSTSEDLLIVRCQKDAMNEKIPFLQKELCRMKKDGVVVLPKGIELFAVPKDVQIVW